MATRSLFAFATLPLILLFAAFSAPSAQAQEQTPSWIPIYNPANHHDYALIVSPRTIAWHEAAAAARNPTF